MGMGRDGIRAVGFLVRVRLDVGPGFWVGAVGYSVDFASDLLT